jgi:hypothetical protein
MDLYNELYKKKEVTSIPDFCKHPELYQTKYDFLKDTILKPRAVYDFFRKAKLKNEGISRCASAKSSEGADDDAITDFMYQQVKSGEEFGAFATDFALKHGHLRTKLYGWKKRYEDHIKDEDLECPVFMSNSKDPKALNKALASSRGSNLVKIQTEAGKGRGVSVKT